MQELFSPSLKANSTKSNLFKRIIYLITAHKIHLKDLQFFLKVVFE